jgi:hypothetical protein
MREKGATTLESFYHTFVIDLNNIVRRHGRRLILWNEAMRPGVEPAPPKDIIIHAWIDAKNTRALAAAGHAMINSSYAPLYLSSYGLREGVALSAVKQWDARLFGAENPRPGAASVKYTELSPRATILGGQACAWASEQTLAEKRLYPRALCMAETLWAEGRAGSLADFASRWAATHEKRLAAMGVAAEYEKPVQILYKNGEPDEKCWAGRGHPVHKATGDSLLLAAGAGDDGLMSVKTHGDFILDFELKTDTTVDFTGVTVRGGAGAPGLPIHVTPPPGIILMKSLRDLKGWHRYEVAARGSVLALTIDGCLAWSVSNAAARSGHIMLQGAGTPREFRNITIRGLD